MKRLLFFTVAAILLSACLKNTVDQEHGVHFVVDESPETLTIGFEDNVETRIQLDRSQKTVWTNGDLVSVFYRSDANQKWQYTGETGARVANLTRVDQGVASETMKRVVVVYPYNKDYYINTETYNLQASLPAVQTYMKDSYGLDGNIMVSQGEYNDISLKSVCGWLKLQITGHGQKVKSITLKGNSGEQVAGEMYINSADATAILSSDAGDADDAGGVGGGLVFENTILKEVTLDCGDGVELGTEATPFYIALPPQTFEKGFTIEIECADYLTYSKTTTKSVTIERNHIHPMTAFAYGGVKIHPDNQIWYTSSDNQAVRIFDADPFDAKLISNTYDAEKKCWVLTFDKKLTRIGKGAFDYDRDKLTSIAIPDGVTTIGEDAFRNCSGLKSVTLSSKLTTIGVRAFMECSSLTSITIHDGVTTIGSDAFNGCSSIKSVILPESVTTIGDGAFSGCKLLTDVNIPNGVSSIEIETFYQCSSLKTITIPDSVTHIGYYAFQYCKALQNVTIGNNVTRIANYAFDWCESLQSITIPENVTSIGYGAFRFCTSLKNVYCHPAAPPVLGNEYVFDENASGRVFYVRISSLDDYKAAPIWSDYSNIIKEDYTPTECTDLTIEADDVPGYMTSATVRYKATTNGLSFNRYILKDIVLTGEGMSSSFDVNPSLTESVERKISYSYLGRTATMTITQGPSLPKSYTVNLNDEWQMSAVPNPDPELFDGVYESFSNYHRRRSSAYMYIDITGYRDFTIYVRNYAEPGFDYVTIWLDGQSVKTVEDSNSDTSLSGYTEITYNDIDEGPHCIKVRFSKDEDVNDGADCGYVLIPINQ